ncbi:MAG: NifB/NifX family molybdenum-iron cluster-binding protein [Clostridia bacterium]|nr:NifB/NifX family molybdenum-iron cluster-binding protein [Clostridia bacterium]
MVKQGANNRYEEDIDMLRIAVTYDNGMVFQHFGHTEQFKVYDTDKGQVIRTEILESNGSGHGALATLLAINKVEVLICGGIGGGAQTALAQAGIRLYAGVQGNADAAVNMFIANKLSYDPNARCDHHGEHHHDHNCANHSCGEHKCGEHKE